MFSASDREIGILCQIQEILNSIGFANKINLPTLIVLGSQSSGKSSVLEHIAGVDFLPRGQGIVTRRPVIIQRLVDPKIKRDYAWTEETGNLTDFRQLTRHLEKKMKEAAQSELGVSNDPVVVKIFASKGVNIGMIDMPGLTKIALKDQNPEFPKIIEDMNRTYIQNPNSILLAVSPANVDVANSDALRLAKEYDFKGERTIGVFTKMDLVEDPNTIRKAFEGRAYSLKLGYYGIVCRNQKDINKGITIEQALKNEQKYFSNNTMFSDFNKLCGIPNLIYQLNRCLLHKIKETLPYVKSTLKNLMQEKEDSYTNYKKVNDLYKNSSYGPILYNIVNSFSNNLKNALKGGNANLRITDKIFGGAKINLIFEKEFHRRLYKLNVFERIKDEEIYWTIKNSSGLQQNVFFSNETFESFAKKQAELLRQPCLDCLLMVNDEIKDIARDILNSMSELELFPNVRQTLEINLEDIMKRYYKSALDAIELQCKIQSGHINQKNQYFVPLRDDILSGKQAYVKREKTGFLNFGSRKETNAFKNDKDVVTMKNLLIGYNKTLQDILYDFTPKAIISLFINALLEVLDAELSHRILTEGDERHLTKIDNNKINKIKNSEKEIETLRKALRVLDELN